MKILYAVVASLLILAIALFQVMDTVQNEQQSVDDNKSYDFSQFPDIYP